MSAEPNTPTILPWHREAAKEIYECGFYDPKTVSAIIARRDRHATTLRLLEEAEGGLCDVSRYPVASAYPDGPCLERETHDNVCKLLIEIRAHLATRSKPDGKKGSK